MGYPDRIQALQLLRGVKRNFLQQMEPLLGQSGLSMPQICLLLGVDSGEIEHINGVCRALGMGPGNASTLCKRLEQDGLLRRERSKEDERVVCLSLTELGRATVRQFVQALEYRWEQAARTYPELERRILDGLQAADELLRRSQRLPQPCTQTQSNPSEEKEPHHDI